MMQKHGCTMKAALTHMNRSVALSALGVAWFWGFSALFLSLGAVSQIDEFALWLLGVILGALLCVQLVGGRVELGFAPLGSLLMSLFIWQLSDVADVQWWLRGVELVGVGLGGGLFVVPLYAFSQQNIRGESLGWLAALTLILSAIVVLALLVIDQGLQHLALSVEHRQMILALGNLAVALFIYLQAPEFFMRLVLWVLIRVMYRIHTKGAGKVPLNAPALLVCNHVSFLDPVIVGSSLPRPARFVMDHRIFKLPLANQFFKAVKAIPIAPAKEDAEMLEAAYRQIALELDEGHLVVIYPEGGITYDGEIQRFRPGVERILARNPVPVYPMALRGVWGSWFSRYRGQALKGLPSRFRARIELVVGDCVAPEKATPAYLEQCVRDLRGLDS